MRIYANEKYRLVSVDLHPPLARRENALHFCNMEDDSMAWSRDPDRTNDWDRFDDENVYDNDLSIDRKPDDHVTYRTLEYYRPCV